MREKKFRVRLQDRKFWQAASMVLVHTIRVVDSDSWFITHCNLHAAFYLHYVFCNKKGKRGFPTTEPRMHR